MTSQRSSLRTTAEFPPNVHYEGVITVTAVPEPATYALMLGGLALVAGAAKRRASR